MKNIGRALVLALVGLAALTGCGGDGGGDGGGGATGDITISVITHSGPGDAFWDVVKSGADRAGDDLGVKVNYSADPDPSKQSGLIDNAVAQKVDGIVVSMANPDGLESSIKAAVEAGIPVVTINSGIEKFAEFGAITHIGQSEGIAGTAVGERLKGEGLTNMVCVIHEAGNVALEQRCQAAADAFGGKAQNLQVDGSDLGNVQTTIRSKLQADKSIDAVLTLNGGIAMAAVPAVQESGSDAKVATFDLSTDVLNAVKDGTILFAVDQQPFVQGYMGVDVAYLKVINGNDVGGGQPIYSGPAFITPENADQVLEFSKEGTR